MADLEAFSAMVTPIISMLEAALPEVEEVKSKPGKFVEKILQEVLETHPLYPLVRKVVMNQVEEDPKQAEQILVHLRSRLNEYFQEGE